jgi:hypothetical protein
VRQRRVVEADSANASEGSSAWASWRTIRAIGLVARKDVERGVVATHDDVDTGGDLSPCARWRSGPHPPSGP